MPSDQPEDDDQHEWWRASTSSMVMWYIATAESPVTVAEISDGTAFSKNTVNSAVTKLFRSDMVERRKREGQKGSPYEYRMVSRTEFNERQENRGGYHE